MGCRDFKPGQTRGVDPPDLAHHGRLLGFQPAGADGLVNRLACDPQPLRGLNHAHPILPCCHRPTTYHASRKNLNPPKKSYRYARGGVRATAPTLRFWGPGVGEAKKHAFKSHRPGAGKWTVFEPVGVNRGRQEPSKEQKALVSPTGFEPVLPT